MKQHASLKRKLNVLQKSNKCLLLAILQYPEDTFHWIQIAKQDCFHNNIGKRELPWASYHYHHDPIPFVLSASLPLLQCFYNLV